MVQHAARKSSGVGRWKEGGRRRQVTARVTAGLPPHGRRVPPTMSVPSQPGLLDPATPRLLFHSFIILPPQPLSCQDHVPRPNHQRCDVTIPAPQCRLPTPTHPNPPQPTHPDPTPPALSPPLGAASDSPGTAPAPHHSGTTACRHQCRWDWAAWLRRSAKKLVGIGHKRAVRCGA